jgi:hypothetical protein
MNLILCVLHAELNIQAQITESEKITKTTIVTITAVSIQPYQIHFNTRNMIMGGVYWLNIELYSPQSEYGRMSGWKNGYPTMRAWVRACIKSHP